MVAQVFVNLQTKELTSHSKYESQSLNIINNYVQTNLFNRISKLLVLSIRQNDLCSTTLTFVHPEVNT